MALAEAGTRGRCPPAVRHPARARHTPVGTPQVPALRAWTAVRHRLETMAAHTRLVCCRPAHRVGAPARPAADASRLDVAGMGDTGRGPDYGRGPLLRLGVGAWVDRAGGRRPVGSPRPCPHVPDCP